MSASEERQLRRDLATGEPGATDRLVHSAMGFAVKISKEYRGLGLPFEELLAEAHLGLAEAAKRFCPDRGTKFTTYAVWWIRRSILTALGRQIDLIRLPYRQMKMIQQIHQAEASLHRSLGRKPTRQEIADHLLETPQRIEKALRRKAKLVSLSQEVGDAGSRTLEDELHDRDAACPEQELLEREGTDLVGKALLRLTPRQRFVLERRFGFGGGKGETLQQVAKRMSLSRERVRQIELEARAKLRQILAQKHAGRPR